MGTARTPTAARHDERGIALLTTMFVGMAVSAIALAGAFWILNSQLIQKNGERAALLNDAAVAAAEEGRSKLNATPAVYPATGYTQLDTNGVVKDGAGTVLPGLRKNTYVGPDGITSGQFGVFGTVITVVTDSFGNKVVRRLQVNQESFAKYAYFTIVEGNIVFANNDQIRGPVHSNDQIKIDNSGATFFDQVTTAAGSISGQNNGNFVNFPPKLSVPPIALPTTAAFTSLQTRASNAGMSFVGNTLGNASGEASVRIEFVAIDLNADGDSTDTNEGFMRIYQDNNRPWYVSGTASGNPGPNGDIRRSPNCGVPIKGAAVQLGNYTVATDATWNGGAPVKFRTAADTNPAGAANAQATAMLSTAGSTYRCYLGGDPRLRQESWPNINANAWNAVKGDWAGTGVGWRLRPGTMGAPAVAAFTGRPDAAYLWPISRNYNTAWEGVIYVSGRVAISGMVNGRVTVASPENIIVADDIRTAVDPGSAQAAECGNILGVFSGDSILAANNTINAPQQIAGAGTYRTYDETTEEDVQAVVLALDIFGAESYSTGSNSAQPCNGTASGRGCLNLNGGIIQNQRGAVGLTSGQGYIKRYTYNSCASSDPPPYFPTTGRFARNRVYELDPRNFDVAKWFAANQNN
jgi:Tfp pilus assembly protein PilX